MKLSGIFLLLSALLCTSYGMDDGLARTPPMGWMSWQRYRCQIDCKNYPKDCINEDLIKRTADAMARDGWREAGYEYVIIDDCWQMKDRSRETSRIVPDVSRFPNGFGALGKYIHDQKLKFGIYLDYGTLTCEKYPGSKDYLEVDAQTMADWEADYIKMDGCYSKPEEMPDGYEKFSHFLNKTGRPIVFSCSYPFFTRWWTNPKLIDWERLGRNCHAWRLLPDVDDSWGQVAGIIEIYRQHSQFLTTVARPGRWNDPDMLVVGNFCLSKDQQRAQMGMWCMFAAPLLISADMDNMDKFSEELLKNRELIAIDQDAGGHQALFLKTVQGVQFWARPLTRVENSWAIALFRTGSGGGPIHLTITLEDMQIPSSQPDKDQFQLVDVFNGQEFGVFHQKEKFTVRINPTSIAMYRVQLKKN